MQYRLSKSILALSLGAALGLAANTAVADTHVEKMPDDSWISISGEVKSVSPDAFVLDYGEGDIVVEMDDWDADADGYKLVTGDEVNVLGIIDDDLFELRTIEANSVYVKGLNTYFYASAADEEDAFVYYAPTYEPGEITVQGTVTEIKGDEVVIDTGLQKLDVNFSDLGYDPLDDEGFQKIKVGDRVSVTGEMDMTFLVDHDLFADSIITLSSRNS